MRVKTKTITIEILRWILGTLFIFSGITKSIDPMGTAIKLTEYMAALSFDIPESLAMVLSVLLCGSELLIGLMLIYGLYRRFAQRMASLFMLFFTLLTLYIVIYNPVKDCGCFGDALIISNEATFVKNLIFMAICGVLLFIDRAKGGEKRRLAAEVVAIILAFSVPLYSAIWLPPMDFMPYNVGVDVAEEMASSGSGSEYTTTLIYKSKEDGSIREFSVEDTTWHDESLWEYVDTKSELISQGDEPSISSFDIIDSEGVNSFDKFIAPDVDALALTIRSRDITPSLAHKMEGLRAAAVESGAKILILSIYPIDQVSGELEGEGITGVEVYNMDETLLKSIVRAKDGYILFKGGVISAKGNLSSSSYINSGEELYDRAKNSWKYIYLVTIFAIFTVGLLLSYKK